MQPFFMANIEREFTRKQIKADQAREARLEKAFSDYQDQRYLSPAVRSARVIGADATRGDRLVEHASAGLTIRFGPDDKFVPPSGDVPLFSDDRLIHRSGFGPMVHSDGKRVEGIDLGKVSWDRG